MSIYSKHFNTKKTPQSKPVPGTNQVPNSAGGFTFEASSWQKFLRFLILVIGALRRLVMGSTDCAQPMLWALQNKVKVDTFVVYTDSETWHGDIHPHQALEKYRQQMGDAKLVVVGMCANQFSIANPKDQGMLDVVGFDTATPQAIAEFSK